MKGTIRLLKYDNIPVFIHWSFSFIFLWVFYNGYRHHLGWEQIIFLTTLLLALFGCVTLHEFGHALMAKRFGINTKDIVLSPIGGIARLDSIPNNPSQEFKIAIAGPAVNVGIALALSPYFLFFPFSNLMTFFGEIDINYQPSLLEIFIPGLIGMNLILAVFNMLPAFPMDGGRVFRALLSTKLSRLLATRIATVVGQLFAVGLVIWGFYQGNIITSFVGVFVFLAATQEFKHVKFENLIAQYKVSDLIRYDYTSFLPSTTLREVRDKINHGLENRFLVIDEDGDLKGVIHEEFVLDVGQLDHLDEIIEPMVSQNFTYLSLDDNLNDVYKLMQSKGYYLLPVKSENEIVGVIDSKMLNQFLRKMKKKRK